MLNKIFIMGRLTRDPELRRTQTGTPVASFSLAVDRDFKDKTTGERATDFIDVVAWRQTAEFVSRYFAKGRMAVVEGRLQIRDWTTSTLATPNGMATAATPPAATTRTGATPPPRAASPPIPSAATAPPPRTETSFPPFLPMTAICRFDFDPLRS